ncbi:hypothetical protein JB92DRAFT_2967301 [Gautieria morchelliformis]|nr:hypothetical protein JB92DRAFT_2967301 [Gautieria morchelliformis]
MGSRHAPSHPLHLQETRKILKGMFGLPIRSKYQLASLYSEAPVRVSGGETGVTAFSRSMTHFLNQFKPCFGLRLLPIHSELFITMGPRSTLAPFVTCLFLQAANAATTGIASSRPIGRPRGSRIAGGIIAAIVVPSLIGLSLFVLCCVCVNRILRRRENTHGTDLYTTPVGPTVTSGMNYGPGVVYHHGGEAVSAPQTPVGPTATSGMDYGPGVVYPHGGEAVSAPTPCAPQQAHSYPPVSTTEPFVGGFTNPKNHVPPHY